MFSDQGLKKVLTLPRVETVLDIGCGNCCHAKHFLDARKKVHAVDIYRHPIVDELSLTFYECDFNSRFYIPPVDCTWASHVLEHQWNVHEFLKKVLRMTKPGGYIVITVPPAKKEIVGGHVSMWNAGLLFYNLVLAGTSCKEVMVKQYGYNITVIVRYNPIALPKLKYDNGDIETLSRYFPNSYDFQGFNGDIKELNW